MLFQFLPPIPCLLFCFLSMRAIHNTFFFLSTIFLKHFVPCYVPFTSVLFNFAIINLSTSVAWFLFQSFCLLNCLLAVKATQGLHHFQWLETQGPIHDRQLATQLPHPSSVAGHTGYHSLPSGARQTGFPFTASG